MSFDWAEYLVLADELGARSNDEAALRSAVSRAYYAAFGKARDRLRLEGVGLPATGEAHMLVWHRYREAAEKSRRSIGATGDRLRRNRNKADYDDEFPGLVTVVRDTITRARRLVESLANLGDGAS